MARTIEDGSARICSAPEEPRRRRSLARSFLLVPSRCVALYIAAAVPLRRAGRCASAYAPRSMVGRGGGVPRDAAGQSAARIAGVRHMAARRLRQSQSQYVAVSRSGNTSERVVARACLRKERSR